MVSYSNSKLLKLLLENLLSRSNKSGEGAKMAIIKAEFLRWF